jgi:hypothetical protein
MKIPGATAIIYRHADAGVRAGGRLGTLRCARLHHATHFPVPHALARCSPIVPIVAGLQLLIVGHSEGKK